MSDNTDCPHCGYWSYDPRKTLHEDNKTIVYCCCEKCDKWFTIIEHAPVITVEMLKERDAEMQRKKEQKSDKQMKAKINKMLYETESTIDNDEWIEVQENAIDGARITAGNGTAIRSCQLNNGQLTALRNAINEYLVDKFVERNNK